RIHLPGLKSSKVWAGPRLMNSKATASGCSSQSIDSVRLRIQSGGPIRYWAASPMMNGCGGAIFMPTITCASSELSGKLGRAPRGEERRERGLAGWPVSQRLTALRAAEPRDQTRNCFRPSKTHRTAGGGAAGSDPELFQAFRDL